MTKRADPQKVKRRQVFYIPGYDPSPPRRYRELYRKEGPIQAKVSGYEIALTSKLQSETFGWEARTTIDGQVTTADVDVLVWSDIVRDSMSNSIPATYFQMVSTAWTYIRTDALRRMFAMRKGPVVAALYPVGVLILQLWAAVILGYLAKLISFHPADWAIQSLFGPISFEPWLTPHRYISYFIGFCVALWVLRWFQSKDRKFLAYYLMHDYAYSARWNGANPPLLEERMAVFADKIAAAFTRDVDEVLIVGHSSGAHLSVSILADLIKAGRVPKDGPALAFLSLGHVVPMVSFLPDAKRLRGDLAFLSAQEGLTWVDVSAPGDGCAYALCDPVSVSGVAPPDKRWPLVISAAFTQTLTPETWKARRWQFFQLHFQYLRAFDNPGDYDYFKITSGPMTLADRYRGRAASASRIETPLSRYTSTL